MEGLYVIYDRIGETMGPVMQCKNDGVARRMAKNFLRNVDKSDLASFGLFKVGHIEVSGDYWGVIRDCDDCPMRVDLDERIEDIEEDSLLREKI